MLSSSLLSGFLYFIGTHGPKYTVECKKRRKIFFIFSSLLLFYVFYCYLFIYSLFTRHFLPLYLHLIWIRIVHFVVYSPVQSDLDAMCVSVSALLYNDFTMRVLTTKTTTKDDRKKSEININIFINSKKKVN